MYTKTVNMADNLISTSTPTLLYRCPSWQELVQHRQRATSMQFKKAIITTKLIFKMAQEEAIYAVAQHVNVVCNKCLQQQRQQASKI